MSKIISLFNRNKSKDTFEALLSPHIAPLFRQAYLYTGSESDAEDLLQDLLRQFHEQFEQIKQVEHLRAWLMRCLHNRFIDSYRKQQRQPELENVDTPETNAQLFANDNAESEQLQAEIQCALNILSPAQRAVVCLHDIEGYSLPELVDSLDLPLGTLKSHLHRGRAIIKKQLQPSVDSERSTVRGQTNDRV